MPDALAELEAALPPGAVLRDPAAVAPYRHDRSGPRGAGTPVAVALPCSTEEVQAVVRVAALAGIPVVARGAGSGLSGGATAIDGSLVVSLERMRDIRVDPGTQTVRAQAGARTIDVQQAAAAHGLWYPPDPASIGISTIGGNVATDAGGLCCVKYGVTGDYVLGLTVVLADGRAVRLGGPLRKDVAGFDLVGLFVGSEGVLGIITEVLLRLVPPQGRPVTLVAGFPSLAVAAEAVVAVSRVMRPSMLELLDATSVGAIEDLEPRGFDRAAAATLLVQSDEPGAAGDAEIAEVARICRAHGGEPRVADGDERDALIAGRRAALAAVERRGAVLLEDATVPVPRIGELVTGIERIARAHAVEIAVVAHAGDGNAHPLVVHDPADADAVARADRAFADVMELAIALGGTITGEHGVGRLKRPWLGAYLGEDALELQRRIKAALDPRGILNPGAVVDPGR